MWSGELGVGSEGLNSTNHKPQTTN